MKKLTLRDPFRPTMDYGKVKAFPKGFIFIVFACLLFWIGFGILLYKL